MTEPNWENWAQAAYEAYGATTDFKNYQGKDMSEWADLPTKIKNAWKAAVKRTYADALAFLK